MTTITVDLPDEWVERLRETAARLGVAPEELVQASVRGLLAEPDEVFQRAAEHVMKKNTELYRRLA